MSEAQRNSKDRSRPANEVWRNGQAYETMSTEHLKHAIKFADCLVRLDAIAKELHKRMAMCSGSGRRVFQQREELVRREHAKALRGASRRQEVPLDPDDAEIRRRRGVELHRQMEHDFMMGTVTGRVDCSGPNLSAHPVERGGPITDHVDYAELEERMLDAGVDPRKYIPYPMKRYPVLKPPPCEHRCAISSTSSPSGWRCDACGIELRNCAFKGCSAHALDDPRHCEKHTAERLKLECKPGIQRLYAAEDVTRAGRIPEPVTCDVGADWED